MALRPIDQPHYRRMISHRTAVRALANINMIMHGRESPYFYGYERGDAGEYDRCVQNMVEEIRHMKHELDKFRALKEALKNIL